MTPCRLLVFCLATFFIGILLPQAILAQPNTTIYTHPNALFRSAMENMQMGNYVLAQKKFDEFLRLPQYSLIGETELLRAEARYQQAMCAYLLDNPDAEERLLRFVQEETEVTLVSKANYKLGQIYFERGKYRDAIAAFDKVDPYSLTTDERRTYTFQLGYSHFTNQKFPEAKTLFSKLMNSPNEYYYPSNYYYGMASYFEGDYDAALSGFQRAEKNKEYSASMPYYISLIYYQQGKFDELLSYAPAKLQQSGVKNTKEINQLVGQTYFNRRQFSQALPYLNTYVEQSGSVRKEDLYQLAYTQHQTNNYADAAKNFAQLTALKDTMGHNALYHLADCYLKLNDKQKARSAFEEASRLNYDPQIKEISAFNYAKLSFELGYQNVAITAFQNFINQYPNSPYNSTAKALLSDVFENTRNYSAALDVLESIPNKTPQVQQTLQRMRYYRGAEFMGDRRYPEALGLFQKSLEYPINADLAALAQYWIGDVYYRTGKLEDSFQALETFMNTTGGRSIDENVSGATANYTLAYILYKQGEYADALSFFDATVNALAGKTLPQNSPLTQIFPDAMLRSGDCHFMQRNYPAAKSRYDDVIKFKMQGIDYAYYQKGMLQGLMGSNENKIKDLKFLLDKYPQSYYCDDALYQIALAQVNLKDYKDAIKTHKQLISQYSNSDYVRRSMVNLGLIYYNLQDYDNSLKYYEEVLQKYPQSKESQSAVLGVRDVYIAKDDADGFDKFIRRFPNINYSPSAKDSLAYEIAENHFAKGDCDKAIPAFGRYLTEYPKGAYWLYARFYRAQCLYSKQDYAGAGKDYDIVLQEPQNLFTEQALDKGSRIALYIEGNYEKSYTYYTRLYENASGKEVSVDALRGLLKTTYHLKKAAEVDKYAAELLANPSKTKEDEIDAYYYMASIAYVNGQYNKALPSFQKTAELTTNEQGAKARYYIAEILYQNKQYDAAKEACFRTINETSSYEYWVVKSFIVLSDIYVAKGDNFQAIATLNSIIENYAPEDDVKKEARTKLAKLKGDAADKSKIKPETKNKDGYLEMENGN